MDGLKTVLKAFLLENPNTAELQNLLDVSSSKQKK